jgi:hypothetical protein
VFRKFEGETVETCNSDWQKVVTQDDPETSGRSCREQVGRSKRVEMHRVGSLLQFVGGARMATSVKHQKGFWAWVPWGPHS